MYNRERTYSDYQVEKAVLTATAIPAEGLLLSQVLEGGVAVVRPCAADVGEVPVGFSSATNLAVGTETAAKLATIPLDPDGLGEYHIDSGYVNIVAGQVRVYDATAATDLTVVAPGAPAPGEVAVTIATGDFSFNAAEAGHVVHIFVKVSLTVEQARLKYFEGFIGNDKAFAVYNRIGVLAGRGTIYTDQFDVSKVYDATSVLTTGADGLITVGGAGTDLSPWLRVVEAPSVVGASQFFQNTINGAFLGLEFNF